MCWSVGKVSANSQAMSSQVELPFIVLCSLCRHTCFPDFPSTHASDNLSLYLLC
ncbi:unnamed protein product [Cylicocyclus nassatus]|uniref:Uncharacterized protein n=1 Tax=Cylicocyclus nassatus TaxID=53992 RepID=A0AA36DSY0_CYLNA|nr:unnamed protein product [Cylicocyclus nassatus]